jgi:hypothetical protein
VEEIKLLKNKNAIISQTLFDLSKFVMPLTGMIEMVFLLNHKKLKKILSLITCDYSVLKEIILWK